jgi:hypothetical protein
MELLDAVQNYSIKSALLAGSIEKVEVFPSQYGKTQLAKEQEKGPDIGSATDEGEDVGKEYSTEALRKYQVRLEILGRIVKLIARFSSIN